MCLNFCGESISFWIMTGSNIGKRGVAQMFAKAGFYSTSQEVVEMITSENKVTGNTRSMGKRFEILLGETELTCSV